MIVLWEGAEVRETPLLGTRVHVPQKWTSVWLWWVASVEDFSPQRVLDFSPGEETCNDGKHFSSGFYLRSESISMLNIKVVTLAETAE